MTDHIDKSEAYRWGWDWAQLDMALHHWMLPHLGTTQWHDAEQGWQDFHDQKAKA